MVRAGYPAGVFAVQSRLADQDILDGVVQHVPHVQYAGDVGRRDHDGVGFPLIRYATEVALLFPVGVPLFFDFAAIVGFGGHAFGLEAAKIRRRVGGGSGLLERLFDIRQDIFNRLHSYTQSHQPIADAVA